MFSEEYVRKIYNRLDKKLFIDTSAIPIVFTYKANQTVGSCHFIHKNGQDIPIKIQFNTYFEQRISAASWDDTIKHEYAHAAIAIITGKSHNHDQVWQQLCLKIGCRPKTHTYNISITENVSCEIDAELDTPTEITCRKCGAKYRQSTKSRLVKLLNAGIPASNYKCPRCGGMLFELTK